MLAVKVRKIRVLLLISLDAYSTFLKRHWNLNKLSGTKGEIGTAWRSRILETCPSAQGASLQWHFCRLTSHKCYYDRVCLFKSPDRLEEVAAEGQSRPYIKLPTPKPSSLPEFHMYQLVKLIENWIKTSPCFGIVGLEYFLYWINITSVFNTN